MTAPERQIIECSRLEIKTDLHESTVGRDRFSCCLRMLFPKQDPCNELIGDAKVGLLPNIHGQDAADPLFVAHTQHLKLPVMLAAIADRPL